MPRYEYKCNKCDDTFEVLHGIDDNVEFCRSCGGTVRRVFHPVGIVFKGSGFYATDSKKPDNRPAKAPESEQKDYKPAESQDNGDKKKDKGKTEKSGSKGN